MALIYGTNGNDSNDQGLQDLQGTSEDDSIYGLEGNDTLIGGAGDDYLVGGAGADTLIGGAGTDTFMINANDGDTIVGFAGGLLVEGNLNGSYTVIEDPDWGTPPPIFDDEIILNLNPDFDFGDLIEPGFGISELIEPNFSFDIGNQIALNPGFSINIF